MKDFPNGFDDWQETHFEIVQEITKQDFDNHDSEIVRNEYEKFGSGGMYSLAMELTDKFELKYKGKQWGVDDDTQYFDALEEFFKEELYEGTNL